MLFTLLLTRLRSHLGRSLMLVAVIAVAVGTAFSALAVRAVADDPWTPLRVATNGSDVVVDGSLTPPDPQTLAAMAAVPEVRDVGVVLQGGDAGLRVGGEDLRVWLLRMPDRETMPVDRPALTAGRWFASDDEAVVETTLADMLGIQVGDEVVLTGERSRPVRVVGAAATAMMPNYPERTPGTVFVGSRLFEAVGPVGEPRWTVGLRLHEPSQADEVAARISREVLPGSQIRTAADIREDAFPSRTRAYAEVALLFAILMLAGAVMLVVTLLGSRLVSEARELTLLQVTGLTPLRLALLIAAEHAVIALAGVLAGIPVTLLAAPRIASAASVLGPVTPDLAFGDVALVGLGAVVVSVIVSALGGLQAGRRSLAVVARGGSGPVRRSRAAGIALASTAWTTLVLGLKDIATRRGRALTVVLGVALAVTMAVPIAGLGAALAAPLPSAPGRAGQPSADPTNISELPAVPAAINSEIAGKIATLVTTMELLLGAIAVITLLAAAAMSMRERTRELGVLHALGCTTPQLVGASAISHGTLGAAGAVIGVPLGIGLYLGLLGLGMGTAAAMPAPSTFTLPAIAAIVIAAAAGAAPAVLAQRFPASVALAAE